jgi:hypothetical protein
LLFLLKAQALPGTDDMYLDAVLSLLLLNIFGPGSFCWNLKQFQSKVSAESNNLIPLNLHHHCKKVNSKDHILQDQFVTPPGNLFTISVFWRMIWMNHLME